MVTPKRQNVFARIYRAVRRVPRGGVMTYGQVARRCRMPNGARVVGYAMAVCPEDVPWQRVVGKSREHFGRITLRDSQTADMQRQFLEGEGVCFTGTGEIDLKRFGL